MKNKIKPYATAGTRKNKAGMFFLRNSYFSNRLSQNQEDWPKLNFKRVSFDISSV